MMQSWRRRRVSFDVVCAGRIGRAHASIATPVNKNTKVVRIIAAKSRKCQAAPPATDNMKYISSTLGLQLSSFLSSAGRTTVVPSVATTRLFMSSPATATTTPSIKYILRYDYVPDVLEKRGPYRSEHLQLAKELCLSGGPSAPLGADVPTGALFIFADLEKANAFIEQDPYVTGGIVTGHTLEAWTVAIEN
jgi:uncharacterized protein